MTLKKYLRCREGALEKSDKGGDVMGPPHFLMLVLKPIEFMEMGADFDQIMKPWVYGVS
jgi:hypothetical protein